MAVGNRTCILCGTKYDWCGHCADNSNKHETWRSLYCSDNCRKIFDILSARAFDHITDREAKEKLNGVDISKIDSFRADFKKQIHQIQSAPNEAKPQPEVKPQQDVKPQQKEQHNAPQNKEIVKQDFKK